MKREIKFRAKTKANGHWVVGSYIHDDNWPAMRVFGGGEPFIVPGTVGQWTGCCDICKEEIFEDDIVRVGICDRHYRYCVAFKDAAFVLVDEDGDVWHTMQDILHCDIDVIGNIHDNPGLLEGGEG